VQYFVETLSYDEYLDVKESIDYSLIEIVEANGGSFANAGTTVVQLSEPLDRLHNLESAPRPLLD
jgi:MscS family membrane protein